MPFNDLHYLQLQPVEPSDDGTVSPLDDYAHDDELDLTQDFDGAALESAWTTILNDIEGDLET